MNRSLTAIPFMAVMFIVGILQAVLAIGFILQLPFATALWPFSYSTGRMSYYFLGSIAAAAAASTLWCVWMRQPGAIVGIGLDYLLIFIPMAVFVLQIAAGRGNLIMLGLACISGALFGIWVLFCARRVPITDTRPQPRLVRFSYIVFVVALILVGGAMILKTPNVIPWSITPDISVIYGWMFLGAAGFFAYSLFRPSWINSGSQLIGFLAYDLVLIVPFLNSFGTVAPQLRFNLIVYTGVLVYSGLLAIYYLFIHAETRTPITPYKQR